MNEWLKVKDHGERLPGVSKSLTPHGIAGRAHQVPTWCQATYSIGTANEGALKTGSLPLKAHLINLCFFTSLLTHSSHEGHLKALWLLLELSVGPGSGIMPQAEGFRA